MVVEEVSGDRPRARKRVRLREDEAVDLEARIERTVKRSVPDVIQAVLSSQNRPATVSNENSDVSATSWSGTIRAAGSAQTQLGNQSIASNLLSRESDKSNGRSVTSMPSAPPVVASTASFLTRNSFASLPGDRLADNVDGQDRG